MGNEYQTPATQRFWAKVLKTNYCWLWIGTISSSGYGEIMVHGKKIGPHRFAYELFRGPIPKGYVIDHLCLTPACVNPDHLEAVSQRENNSRGLSLSAKASRQTHCKHAHPLEGKNLIQYANYPNRRFCRLCNQARDRERDRRRITVNGKQVRLSKEAYHAFINR